METKPLIKPVAVKVLLGELNNGSYIEEDEQSPNYFLTADQRKIYRLNIMGVVIDKQKQGSITNFLLDDNTGKIVMRTFEDSKFVNELNVGEAILVIGRIRKYNQEKYISPEIIKKINPLWLKARSMEFESKIIASAIEPADAEDKAVSPKMPEIKPLHQVLNTGEEVIIEEEIVQDEELPTHKLMVLIKEMDGGNGALIEEVIEKSTLNDTEKLLQKMLEKGDVFQNLPGRVKVL